MSSREEWEKEKVIQRRKWGRSISNENVGNQYPVNVQVKFLDDGSCFEDIMATSKSPEFNPLTTLNFNHAKETDDEEYRLFGTPSSSSSSSPQQSDDESSDEDEMDDDTGPFFFFSPLTNVNAELNFFINNELTDPEMIFDYLNEEYFGGSNLLSNECLLVSMYIHYFNFTQSNNFKRTMKNERWIGKVVEKKLI